MKNGEMQADTNSVIEQIKIHLKKMRLHSVKIN